MAATGHPDPRVSSSRPRPAAASASVEHNRHHRDRYPHHSHRHRAREPYPSENPKETTRYPDPRYRDRDYRDRPSRRHSDAPDTRVSDKSRSSSSDEGRNVKKSRVSEPRSGYNSACLSAISGPSSDRESGELSMSRSTDENSVDMKRSRSSSLDNGASSAKHASSSPAVPVKRKFTPIVWDLDEKRNNNSHGSSGRHSRSPVVSAKVSSTAAREGNIGHPVESGRSRGSSDDYIEADQRTTQVRNMSAISPNESSGRQLSVCDVNDEASGEDPTTHPNGTVSSTRTSRWANDNDEEEDLPIRTSRWAKDYISPSAGNDESNTHQSPETMDVRTSRWADKEASPPRKQQNVDESPENVPIRTSRWAEPESSNPNGKQGTDSDEEDGLISPNGRQEQQQEVEKAEPMSLEPGEYVEEKPAESGDQTGCDVSKENDDSCANDDVQMDDDHDVRDESDSEPTTRSKENFSDQELSDLDSEDEAPATPPSRAIDMLRACRSVNDFEKLNRVNEGTYGVVYKARDKKTGEIVALKKVKMEKEREGFPITSLREINILLSIRHPSIVNVKEVVVGGNLDSIFMVMEYMENDLKRYVETLKHPLNEKDVKRLMRQLFEGMKYLHDNWIVHRDLKTSNLLLNAKGELKICDFGLARQYGTPLKTYTNNVVTLWYRPPELLLGCKHYSTAVDMWSLGCIMAELLSKEPLFNAHKEIDQLNKIFRVLGTPNEEVWPEYPSLVKNVKFTIVKQKYNKLREKFPPIAFGRPTLSETGFNLLSRLLLYDPSKRLTAEEALNHDWFVKDDGI